MAYLKAIYKLFVAALCARHLLLKLPLGSLGLLQYSQCLLSLLTFPLSLLRIAASPMRECPPQRSVVKETCAFPEMYN